jgi:hypothetical protein
MDINQFQALLNESGIEEGAKAEAVALFTSGKQAEAMAMAEKLLVQKMGQLDAENPEAAAEYKAAEAEYSEAIDVASKEFDATMGEIEVEANQLEADTAKELDAVRMAEVQEDIQKA